MSGWLGTLILVVWVIVFCGLTVYVLLSLVLDLIRDFKKGR